MNILAAAGGAFNLGLAVYFLATGYIVSGAMNAAAFGFCFLLVISSNRS